MSPGVCLSVGVRCFETCSATSLSRRYSDNRIKLNPSESFFRADRPLLGRHPGIRHRGTADDRAKRSEYAQRVEPMCNEEAQEH